MSSESTATFATPEEELLFWKQKAQDYKFCLEETRDELEEFQSSSRDLEAELEAQLEQQETRCSDLRLQVNRLAIENQSFKERLEKEQDEFSGQLTKLQEELTEIKQNKEQLIRYVRELEQANDDLERAKRATLTSLEDFEARLNQAIERNAFLESELDEKEALKVMVQRLKDEARDLRQEVTVHRRTDSDLPDNDKAAKHQLPLLKQQLSLQMQQQSENQPIIDSNKLISENDLKTSTKCHNLHNLNNGSVPLTPSARISALNIVGDLLRKVGALESRLASCRTLVKDNQRPLSLPPGNRSARDEELLTPLSPVSADFEMIIV